MNIAKRGFVWAVLFMFRIVFFFRKNIPNQYLRYTKSKLSEALLLNLDIPVGDDITLNGYINVSNYTNLVIGESVTLGNGTYLDTRGGIVIGDESVLGEKCNFFTRDYSAKGKEYFGSIYVGRNVIIGDGVMVLPGAVIMDCTVVPTGAIVKKGYRGDIRAQSENRNVKSMNRRTIALNKGENLFFVVSTGRSGSLTMANYLSQHSEITCLHEPRNHLIRISTNYEYGLLTFDQVLEELDYLYNKCSVIPSGIYGESHQKLSNLIHPLSILFPKAKFIWLIRDGRNVVKSCTNREWYVKEKTKVHPYRGKNIEGWDIYRLRGDSCGIYTENEWESLTSFGKNCWYWAYWNTRIKDQLSKLKGEQYYFQKLEDLEHSSSQLQGFLNTKKTEDLNIIYSNKSNGHNPNTTFVWDKQREKTFQRICGDVYGEFYNLNG